MRNDGLMSRKVNVSLFFHVQEFNVVDFLYADMRNSSEYPDYQSVLSGSRLRGSSEKRKEVANNIILCGKS